MRKLIHPTYKSLTVSNYRRSYLPGATYFFTVVTHKRTPWFDCDKRVEILRNAFRKTMAVHPFYMDAIVVLPDHLHCLWQLPEEDSDFSNRWREIKKSVSKSLDPSTNARNECTVWQRRFWEHTIRDEADWRNHMDYIHYNPVKHGLAKRPGDWQWSSFTHAVGKGWYDPDWGAAEPMEINSMDLE